MKASSNFAARLNRLRTSLLRLLVNSLENMTSYELAFGYLPTGQFGAVGRRPDRLVPIEGAPTASPPEQCWPDESEWGWI